MGQLEHGEVDRRAAGIAVQRADENLRKRITGE